MAEHRVVDFGTKMKRAREARGVSLRQIATATKISVAALEALERNDISRLPGGIFSRAFVRSYAIEVGLDPEDTVRDFLTQFPHDSVTAGSPHVPQEDHEAIESDRQSAQTALKLISAAVPLAIVILYLTLSEPPARPPAGAAATRAESGAAATSTASEPSPSAPGAPAPPGGEAVVPLSFEILATAPVTLEVTIDGTRRESRGFAAGERLVFQAQREMTLGMSDARAVQLTINGQPAVSLGAAGEARTVQIGRQNYGSFLASQ
ncbi:MAG TPA: RodZ domain-containing protein [Vicinamibacterales bacterium]|nr:RodZ domain-containing protein [Vicinamibacterales bacterium]